VVVLQHGGGDRPTATYLWGVYSCRGFLRCMQIPQAARLLREMSTFRPQHGLTVFQTSRRKMNVGVYISKHRHLPEGASSWG